MLAAVIIGLLDLVELMVVAPGTADRQPRNVRPVVSVMLSRISCRCCTMFAALISSGYKRIARATTLGILRLQFVAGQLLADEAIVGQIVVEGAE